MPIRSKEFVIVMAVLGALFAGVGALLVYDAAAHDTIAQGISVGGVDIGGLSAAQARQRLKNELVPGLERTITVTYHGHRFRLTARAARVRIDVDGTVSQALDDSRSGSIFTRVYRSLTGGHINERLAAAISFSHAAVDRLARRAAAALDRRSRNARVSFSASSLGVVPGQTGVRVDTGALAAAIEHALSTPSASARIRIPVGTSPPAVTLAKLAGENPTVITVDRLTYQLRLWKRLKLAKTYPIAVGMAGLETPAGLYHIQDKQVNPSWFVPKSAWAGSLAGQVIPPGPADPIKARWMGIFNGAGIHGIDPSEYWSIGHNASHGCIRMTIPDVIDLYDRTPVGAPVYIG